VFLDQKNGLGTLGVKVSLKKMPVEENRGEFKVKLQKITKRRLSSRLVFEQ